MARKVFTPDDPALPMNYPGFVFRTLREEGYPAKVRSGSRWQSGRDPDRTFST
jgi:hypothetical protein